MKNKDNDFLLKVSDFLGIFISTIFLSLTYVHLIKSNNFVSFIYFIFIFYFILSGLIVNFKLKTYKSNSIEVQKEIVKSVKYYTNFKLDNILYYCIVLLALILPFIFKATYEILFSIIIFINFTYQIILQNQILKTENEA